MQTRFLGEEIAVWRPITHDHFQERVHVQVVSVTFARTIREEVSRGQLALDFLTRFIAYWGPATSAVCHV